MLIGGIDEAGRGPAIGPMVMAIAVMNDRDEFKLQALGIKDSKLLLPKKRAELFEIIGTMCETAVVEISPEEIDRVVNASDDNLNWLEARKAVELISKVKAEKVILDCPSNNLQAYKKYIKDRVKNEDIKIVVEHKADLNHTIVGAGSILAKVVRDDKIRKIIREIGIDFGSGYSSDPRTQEFIANYWNHPEYSKYMRKSWDTWQKHYRGKTQKNLGEF